MSLTNTATAAATELMRVTPTQLRTMLADGDEIAVLDVREEGVYARDGHLLLVSNVPLSHIETRLLPLVPRKSVRIVVCDGNDGLAERAAARMQKAGYTNVMLLAGGTPAWAAAGFPLYTGVYVPSKAFGEYVHHHDKPPEVTPEQLAQWKQQPGELLIVDSRPLAEYRRNTIPGSIDCPSAELAYRVHDMVQSPQTRVVVNCGGRTRAIIGAQSLINAGLENPVFALQNGTQGWHLAGLELAKGCTDQAPLPTVKGLARAQAAAARVAKRFGVQTITKQRLQELQQDPERTVYLLDVRSPEEFIEGHLPGSVPAQGGQLVQETDTYIGVRNATVVLVDDNGVRATMTAAWLVQMGWAQVYVLEKAFEGVALRSGPWAKPMLEIDAVRASIVSAVELKHLLAAGQAQVVDLATSLEYREGHIAGAWHAVRSRFDRDLAKVPHASVLVLTSPDGVLARVAAGDAMPHVRGTVKVLDGGNAAWRAAKLPFEQGDERMTGPDDDMRYKALDQPKDVEQAAREYLKWEIELMDAIESDPDFGFKRFAKAG